jgi:Subtilase family
MGLEGEHWIGILEGTLTMPDKSKTITEALDKISDVLEPKLSGELQRKSGASRGAWPCCYDFICGELLLCFPKIDPAAQQLVKDIIDGKIEHVSHIESLEQKLARLNLRPDEDLEFDFHRLSVPVGEELWKVTYLQFFYKINLIHALGAGEATPEFLAALGRSDFQFTAMANSVISLAAKRPGKDGVKATDFAFTKLHEQYKTMLRIPSAPPSGLDQVTIAVIDSGIADDARDVGIDIADKRNMVDPVKLKGRDDVDPRVTDENGHGTVIALILHEVSPGARLLVYKVADADGRISEWDAVAAMAVCSRADIVNLSVQFGLKDRVCEVCGRESHSSRSIVFENMVNQFANRRYPSILIAAAGNNREGALAFPARFGPVLAIGAVTSTGELSDESNYGKQYNLPGTPDNHFVCPGGDETTDPLELIGSFRSHDDLDWHGTSFAAAYASGVVANLIARQGVGAVDHAAILKNLRDYADPDLPEYDETTHGHGIMRCERP